MAEEAKWGRRATARDGGVHYSDAPGWWEWWYFDADFDNGYTMVGTFHFGSPRPPANPDARFIEVALYDPQGNRRMVRERYPKDQCSAAEETCRVVIGPNILEGEPPKYHLFFQDRQARNGCDITFESMVEPIFPKPASSMGAAVTEWVVHFSRAKVSGTMTWDGKTTEVKGVGYHDHNWSDAPFSAAGDIWDLFAVMRLIIGDWTLVFSGGRYRRTRSYEPFAAMHAYKKEKMVAVTHKGGGIGSDYTTSDFGIERPQAYTMWFDEPGVVEGKVDFKVTQVIEFMDLHRRFKPFQRWFAETYVGRPAYFRYRLHFDADLTIAGEKVRGEGPCWCEHHKML